jgi:hypothetical protein
MEEMTSDTKRTVHCFGCLALSCFDADGQGSLLCTRKPYVLYKMYHFFLYIYATLYTEHVTITS